MRRHLALFICAAALLLKIVVPAGYMVASDGGRVTMTLCSGVAPRMTAMHGDMAGHGKPGEHQRVELPCAFAGLSAPATGPVDAVQVAAFVAFVMAVALLPVAIPAAARPPRLRPPLRGPPART